MAANFGKTQAWGWADGEDSWGSDVNNNFATVDRLLNNPVKGIVSDPTTITSPSNNDLYIVGESATGDFALQEGKLAYWSDVAYGGDDSWKFITAPQGQSFSMEDGSVRTYSEVSGVKYWIQSNSVIVHTWADFKYAMQSPSFATIEIGTEIVATGSDLFTVPVYKRVMGVGLAIEGTTLTLNTSQVDFFCDVTIGTALGVAGVLTGDSALIRFRRLTALTSSSSTTTVATQYEVLSGVVTGTVQNFWESTADAATKLDKVDTALQSVASPVDFLGTVTLTSTASETPIKTLGRNADNEIIEFDNSTDTTTSGSTGVLTGGVLSTGAGSNQYSISDGTGQLADGAGVVTPVSWSGKSNIVPTNLATNLISWVGIDSAGNVVEQVTAFTRAQARTIIILGVVVHVNLTTVDAVNNEQHIAYNAMSSTYDLAESIGFFNVEGNIFSANGANLNIDQSNGKIFKMGSNYDLAPVDNPHVRSLASLTALSFQYRFSDGSNGVTGIAVDPTTLDDGSGGTTTVPNNHFSIQRIYVFTSGNVKLQRGVASYPNLDSALAGYSSEAYVTEPSIEANGLLRGFLVVREDTTDLTDTAKAVFISAPKFGEGGGSTGASASALDLQTGYNNSVTPEITTDTTRGALTLKRGSALDADNVLEVKNGAGTTNASITGDGESTFNGDMTLLNTKNGTWTVDESIRRLNFYSSDTSGSGVGNVGWIDTRVTTTFGTGCDMVFGTAPSGGEATESMRLSRLGDLTAIGDGTFGGTGSFGGSTNIDNVLALTSATFYKKDGFNNWATGVFNASNDFNIFLYDKTTGAYSSSFIKLTHDTNQIQLQKDTIVSGSFIQGGVTDTGEGLQGDSLRVDGDSEASSFTLSALNTAPTSATDTGTTGEIRWDADYMYVCTATDTWKRSAIATW